MIIQELLRNQLVNINPPKWLPDNCAYITIMGSEAYGVSSNSSDQDMYGFCFPPKEVVFPHLAGEIPGFGDQIQRFDQWQQHHIKRPDNGREYDFSIYSIVKYFQLCMENNPNMIDSLFTPEMCVQHSTEVGNLVREHRKMFLHKGCWHKFKGYAYSQIHKIEIKNPDPTSKRYQSILDHGYDVKFAYHVVRLLGEVEQILTEGDLELTRNREQLKSIRRGEWTKEEIKAYFMQKQAALEAVYNESKLPHKPPEASIKHLLMNCLESHYGTISKSLVVQGDIKQLIADVQGVIAKYAK